MVDVSDLIGVKYTEHGRSAETGFDCWGLLLEVERRMGKDIPDFDYIMHDDKFVDDNARRQIVEGHAKKVSGLSEGVIILFENAAGLKNHVGVYLEDGYFVHCNGNGVHLDKIDTYNHLKKGYYIWQS